MTIETLKLSTAELNNLEKSLERQLKEQVKAIKDAERCLRKHAMRADLDNSLIPDMGIQDIIEQSEAIKVLVFTIAPRISQRNRQRTPSVEQSQSPRHQDPSPNGRLPSRWPGDPRIPPQSGGKRSSPERQTTDSAPIHLVVRPMDSPLRSRSPGDHRVPPQSGEITSSPERQTTGSTSIHQEVRRTDSPLRSRRPSGSQDAQEIIDIASPQEETTVSAPVCDASVVSPESQGTRKLKIVGPRIHDDGHGLRVIDGEWPSEISASSQISADLDNGMAETHASVLGSTLGENRNAGGQTVEQESEHQGPGHGTDHPAISTNNGPFHISKHSRGSSVRSSTSTPQQRHEPRPL